MKLRINFENRQTKIHVSYNLQMLLRRAVTAALMYEGVRGACEVSITFTDDEGIRALNKQYREIDRATDVLSFPQIDFNADGVSFGDDSFKALGDIVISLERAAEQGAELSHSTEHEAAFLCVHSVLHLLGYDHVTSPEDEKKMFARQRMIIKILGKDLEFFDKEKRI